MRVELSREAQEDIDAAVDWYIEKEAFIAVDKFADEIDRALDVLARHPAIGGGGRVATRLLTLQEFPYTLVYRVMQDHVRVIAVAHHSRRPGYWRGRR